MQPNQPQGYYRPDQNQPVGPAGTPPAAQPPQPLRTVQPLSQQSAPVVDPAALQQALTEPSPPPATVPTTPAPQAVTQPATEQFEGQIDNQSEEDYEYADEPITWTAHEYIHQEKGTMWFVFFGVIILALLAASIFIMKSISFSILLAVIAVVIVIYTRRPPRELTYSLTDEGLLIDQTLHKFSDFKSFGIIRDGEEFSVMLIPIRRFQPGITVYFPEEAGEDIVDILGSRLPMKDLKLDAVDRVVRLLRL